MVCDASLYLHLTIQAAHLSRPSAFISEFVNRLFLFVRTPQIEIFPNDFLEQMPSG
uniref:Uncharacterized protein n=1 Tax=Candidatus Kentrum sp. SD TaxID=2126332 RepID=A0A450Z7Z8_9GAMM|nr:MAG: hypothetical protein BECKSD772F_GA0070984_102530 [Candidatus Kentron sp. SD]VFK49937.1 MAG: hypothetical protein BECKSD772E_GA0070983_12941 [Candidatus Kentron sp. SD]